MATLCGIPHADIDPFSLEAIVQLQLEDARQLAANDKGKQREGMLSDAELALQLYTEDLLSCDTSLADRKMAYSIGMAVMRDGQLIEHAFEEEQQFAEDRAFAASLEGRQTSPVEIVVGQPSKSKTSKGMDKHSAAAWRDPEMLAKAAALYMAPLRDVAGTASKASQSEPDDVPESSTWAANRKDNGTEPRGHCIACGDDKDFYEVARVPCDHEYCRPCLESLFRLSIKDETLFPPRCDGQEIPLGRVRFFLPAKLAKEFEQKYEELSTKNRTYCHNPACSTFIPPEAVLNEVGTCHKCQRTTCAICKAPSHSGDCPQDQAVQQLIQTADQEQWQRCYQCNRFVELGTGCNHMTCYCGAHFCYVCGLKWKTCQCPQWDEARLTARAEQIVERNPRRQLHRPAYRPHAQPVAEPATMAWADPDDFDFVVDDVVATMAQTRIERNLFNMIGGDDAQPTIRHDEQAPIHPHEEWLEDWEPAQELAVNAAANARRVALAEAMAHLRENHESGTPVFHEGQKGYRCCKPRVLTFDEFLTIPPCTTGKHTTVDDTPAPLKVTPDQKELETRIKAAAPVNGDTTATPAVPRQAINAQPPQPSPSPAPVEEEESDEETAQPKDDVTCKRRGCGSVYKAGQDRSTETCVYHPGAPIFHEGSKGYTCCKRRVLEFDDFMRMQGCKRKSRHLFVGKPKPAGASEAIKEVRSDFYQTATTVIASLFLKKIDKDKSNVVFQEETQDVDLDLQTSDQKQYKNKLELYGPIIAEKSSFKILGTKLELTLAKADGAGWPVLQRTDQHTGEIIQPGRAGRLER